MTDTAPKLEPCDFCGGSKLSVPQQGYGPFSVMCRFCGAKGPTGLNTGSAIAAWNTRTHDLSAEAAGWKKLWAEAQAACAKHARRGDDLSARLAAAEEALTMADEAIGAWLHQYAGEFCDEKLVAEHAARIKAAGGTLAYIAEVHGVVRKALASPVKDTPATKPCPHDSPKVNGWCQESICPSFYMEPAPRNEQGQGRG